LRSFDCIIVGHGLAGGCLAWELHRQGLSFVIVDPSAAVTSSKIAAGLVTPITGQRLHRHPQWEELSSAGKVLYGYVAQVLGQEVYHTPGMVRLFQTAKEEHVYANRRAEVFGDLIRDPAPPLDPACFHLYTQAMEMPAAGQLKCGQFLSLSEAYWKAQNRWLTGYMVPDDCQQSASRVTLPEWEIDASRVVFCRGYQEMANPAMPVNWQAAKGEILGVRIPGLAEERIINRGVWLVRGQGDVYRTGSSYDWDHFDETPTTAKQLVILGKLRAIVNGSIEVVSHQAGVRPILRDQTPAIGSYDFNPQIHYLNGLGSRGALYAPRAVHVLVNHLFAGDLIPPEWDIRRFIQGKR
jgi:glycine oxidase